MTKFEKQKAIPCKFQKKIKGPFFHFREISVNFAKSLKNRHFLVGGSKNLKHSRNTCFSVSFQKNILSSFLLFLSVFYQGNLSDSERNEIASSTARNFNNSWLLYVKFSETINLCRNIWLIENWKCQLFLFLK